MVNLEPITLSIYPIWQQQEDEPDKPYDCFLNYYLPLAKRNLKEAYRRYLEAKKSSKVALKGGIHKDWTAWCKAYRWEDRHIAYHRQQAFNNLEFINQRRLELIESELRLSQLLMARATDLLTMGISENDRMKDAPMLARAASELSRKALNLDGLDGHVAAVIRAGFEVTDPTLLVLESDKIEGANND
jgi:hypothetical protein